MSNPKPKHQIGEGIWLRSIPASPEGLGMAEIFDMHLVKGLWHYSLRLVATGELLEEIDNNNRGLE